MEFTDNSTNTTFHEVPCKKAVNGASFKSGVQEYSFAVGSGQCLNLAKSHFIVEATLTASGGVPSLADGLALSNHVGASLFDAVSFRIGNQEVSSQKNYVAQAHALKSRISRPDAVEKSIGRELDISGEPFGWRQGLTASDGLDTTKQWSAHPISTEAKTTITLDTDGTAAVASGNNSNLTFGVGDTVVVAGREFKLTTKGADGATTGSTVSPFPDAKTVGTTSNSYYKKYEPSRRAQTVWFRYRPKIGIMDVGNEFLSGNYSFFMTPNSNYQKACVEALFDRDVGDAKDSLNYDFQINNIRFFANISNVPVASDAPLELILSECEIVSKTYSNSVLDFVVPSSTHALAIMVQGVEAGSDNRLPLTEFRDLDGNFKNIRNLQVIYGNVSKPAVDYSSTLTATENGLTQRYLDSYSNCGLLHSEGGAEDFSDWQKSPFYFFDWTKDAKDRSSNLQVRIKIDNLANTANVLVCALYTRGVVVTSKNGYVLSVNSLTA